MDWFLLQPVSVLALTQALLLFIITLNLLSIKHKTRGTWLLAIAFGAAGLIWVEGFLVESLYTALPFSHGPLDELASPIALYALLHFAYGFVYTPFPRESRIVLLVTGLLVGANAVYQIYRMITFANNSDVYELCFELGNLVMILGSLSVYVRKRARLSKAIGLNRRGRTGVDQAEQTGKERAALRAFALLTVGLMLLSFRAVWVEIVSLWPELGTPAPFLALAGPLAFVFVLVGFVVVYINHMPDPTTLQAKIIGISLATVLAVLGIAPFVLYSKADLIAESWARTPQLCALRFQPDGDRGYRVARAPVPFDAALGDDLDLEVEGDTLVALGFAFPFDGTRWDELFIDANGVVSFGGAYKQVQFVDFLTDEHPKIAPYYRAIIPKASAQSGVFFKAEAGKATVTWFLVRERYSQDPTNRNTIQLVLHADGVIDFMYDRLEAQRFNGFRGLRPGGAQPPVAWNALADLPALPVAEALLPQGHTIRFEPRPDRTYQATKHPARFDADLGEALPFRQGRDPLVPFGFTFPFFGNDWQEAYVSKDGVVTFGAPIGTPARAIQSPFRDFYAALPMIAPLFAQLDPLREGAGIYYKQAADHVTITWRAIPVYASSGVSTVQLVLHQNGAIDFTYQQVGIATFAADRWGLYPGDGRLAFDAVRYLSDAHAVPMRAGAALIDDFEGLRDLAYRRFVHAKVAPLAAVVLASTLFILALFPLFFRTSLIKPLQALLQGVRRVDEGDRDAQVPVRVNDEIGTLARSFNEMTASLKTAEDQLRAYAEGLEEKVAERTQDLQQALHHLTEAQDQLILAEKMASLGQLTAGIAHEIKNPLNFVNNFAQLSIELADELEEEIAAHEDKPVAEIREDLAEILGHLKQNAAKIREHGKRADGIVQSMLEHSRGGEGERRAVAVNAFVNEYVNLAYHGMRANTPDFNVTIERAYDEAVGTAEMTPQEMGRVFINLLTNAFYATYQKAVSAGAAYAPTVRVSTQRAGDTVTIRIADNGPGIPKDFLKKIFEPFYTTKPTGEGTGLGLSISYDIVTQGHGGTLAVGSAEGEGATFVVTLPAKKP